MTTQVAPKFSIPLSVEAAIWQARLLKALASPARLRILSLLAEHSGEVSVDEIEAALQSLKQPTISHHLGILRNAKLIDYRQHNTYRYYFVCGNVLVSARQVIAALGGNE